MTVNDELIEKLANLAKLEFDDKTRDEIKQDLTRMLAFVDQLNEVDTDGVEPLIFMSEEINRLREDIPRKTISQEEALKNAPHHDSDYIMVPKVLSKGR